MIVQLVELWTDEQLIDCGESCTPPTVADCDTLSSRIAQDVQDEQTRSIVGGCPSSHDSLRILRESFTGFDPTSFNSSYDLVQLEDEKHSHDSASMKRFFATLFPFKSPAYNSSTSTCTLS